jgi:NhaA family Na+:H+ antiporter
MALFFLLMGLEIKRELLEGELSSWSEAFLPVSAALGGVLCPILFYGFFNWHDAQALHGWATASATDIAFSLCVLSLCGARIPLSLRVFLTAIAVIDDLAAIIIIALFYSASLSFIWLLVAGLMLLGLWLLGRQKIVSFVPYGILGVLLWLAVLATGVHATVAGVLLGLMIPLKNKGPSGNSMLLRLERALHPWVSYAILPLFAFANAGIHLNNISENSLTQPITLGVITGLFFGKQIGIMLFVMIPVMLGIAKLPKEASWLHIYGVAILAGIGFTMSLFIGSLAFGEGEHFTDAKLGIIVGSLLSAIIGYVILSFSAVNPRQS